MTRSAVAASVAMTGAVLFLASLALPRVVLAAETLRRRTRPSRGPAPEPLPPLPSVDVVIPAYLESGVIGDCVARINRALERYDGVSNVVVVASDDETADAARAAGADVLLMGRGGKPAAANRGVAVSTADVIVMTDANCTILPDDWIHIALRELGRWSLVSANKTEAASGEVLFWQLERRAKRALSAEIGTVSVVGEFLAFRRDDYIPIPPHAICDDLWLAVEMAARGKQVKVIDELSTVEEPAKSRDQWERRVRITSGLFVEQLPNVPRLSRFPLGRIFMAHKLYRVTIGTFGFWLAIVGVTLAWPPLTWVTPCAVALAVLRYVGLHNAQAPAGAVISAFGMQAVPVAAAWRAVKRRRTGVAHAGWTKVSR